MKVEEAKKVKLPLYSGYHWARKRGCNWVVVNVISSGILRANSYETGFVIFTDAGRIRSCKDFDEYIEEPIEPPKMVEI